MTKKEIVEEIIGPHVVWDISGSIISDGLKAKHIMIAMEKYALSKCSDMKKPHELNTYITPMTEQEFKDAYSQLRPRDRAPLQDEVENLAKERLEQANLPSNFSMRRAYLLGRLQTGVIPETSLQLAIQQLTGYVYTRDGATIVDIVEGMGLTHKEWQTIRYTVPGLSTEETLEVDTHFLRKASNEDLDTEA